MAKLEAGDKSSNSLLANVLDMDDDFLLAGGLRFCLLLFKLLRKISYFLPHFVKSGTLEIQDKVVARVPSRHVFQVVRCIRLC